MTRAAILTIGDELLIGQVTNGNAAWMSEQLTAIGIEVREHLTVGDTTEAISAALDRYRTGVDFVLVSGGLGPTHDDITVEVVAKHLGLPLEFDDDWVEKVRVYFTSRNRTMPDNNLKQAYRPKGSRRLDNDLGTAPGIWIPAMPGKCPVLILMPGVPFEMQGLMQSYVLPELKSRPNAEVILQKTLLTTGIGESVLAQRIGDLTAFLSATTTLAYLPSPLGVRLRMTVKEKDHELAQKKLSAFEQRIVGPLGSHLYGEGDVSLEEVVGQLLLSKKMTIATAESCTGGLVSDRLTNVSGSSAYVIGSVVAYSNEVKKSQLGVRAETIEKFGAVSDQCAKEMAEGVRRLLHTDIAVALTGVAGPTGGTPEKPVGLVWIAVADARGSIAFQFRFEKDRRRNKERSSQAALDLVRQRLMGLI